MSNAATQTATSARRLPLALAGLVLTVTSPLFWTLTLYNNLLQRTALMMWIAMAAGLACAALAAGRDRRARTRVVAGLTAGWVLFSVIGYFIFTRLPAPTEPGQLDQVANLVLADHLGQQTSIGALLHEGPLLFVFYRGHW